MKEHTLAGGLHKRRVPDDQQPLLGSGPAAVASSVKDAKIEESEKESHDSKIKRILKIFGWAILVAVALAQAIGAGFNNAAAMMKALPSIGAMSLGAVQGITIAFGITGMIMNMWLMIKLFPTVCVMLKDFVVNFKKNMTQSPLKSALFIASFVMAASAAVAVGVFTYNMAPIAIYGMLALFGGTVFPPLIPVAITLGLIQGLSIFALMFKAAVTMIENGEKAIKNYKAWKAVQIPHQRNFKHYRKKVLKPKYWPSKEDVMEGRVPHQKDCPGGGCSCHTHKRIETVMRGVLVGLGIVILVGGAIFATIVEGQELQKLAMKTWAMSEAAATALTVGLVYVSATILSVILNINAADGVFGTFASKLEPVVYKTGQFFKASAKGIAFAVRHPIQACRKAGSAILRFPSVALSACGRGLKKAFNYTKKNPGKVAWNVFKFGSGLFILIFIIGNTLGNAAIGSHGVPGHNSHNASAEAITNNLNPELPNANPCAVVETLTTPQAVQMNPAQVGASAVMGLESFAVVFTEIKEDIVGSEKEKPIKTMDTHVDNGSVIERDRASMRSPRVFSDYGSDATMPAADGGSTIASSFDGTDEDGDNNVCHLKQS